MAARILTRIGHAVLSILLLTVVVFWLVRITGDPSFMLLPETATEEDFERLRDRLGLDEPLIIQYFIYMSQVIQGDLGQSIRLNAPVTELVLNRLPWTLLLSGAALVIVLIVGIPLGIFAAYHRGGAADGVARFGAALGMSAPSFWVGLILILVFAVNLGVLPAGGYGGLSHFILPAISIAVAPIAGLTRLLRSSMIEVLSSDYVQFLRIKGVPERNILWKHGLRNAGLTTLTFVGVLTAGLVTGSVVAELVFNWPGIGLLMADSIRGRDFTVVQGVVLLFSVVYITVNLLVDLSYIILNPRLR